MKNIKHPLGLFCITTNGSYYMFTNRDDVVTTLSSNFKLMSSSSSTLYDNNSCGTLSNVDNYIYIFNTSYY